MFGARPEPDAGSRRGAPRAAGALVRVCLRNFFDEQRVEPAIGIIAGEAGQAGINDQPHAINCDARLRNVRGHHHFALRIARHGGILILRLQFAMQRQNDKAFRLAGMADGLNGLCNFKTTGHENQHIPFAAAIDVTGKFFRR